MTSVEEALAEVARALPAATPAREAVPIDAAFRRVLAADVAMDHDVPGFRRSSMDGYALASGLVHAGARVPLSGRVLAGDPPPPPLVRGTAVAITTGAPLPEGADRVVPVEWTRRDGDHVVVDQVPGDAGYVVEAGAFARRGEVVVHAGTRLGAGHLSALATAGVAEVAVFRRPEVAVLGTGSELVDVGAPVPPGHVRNSNGVMLRAQARSRGAEVLDLGIVPDDRERLGAAVRAGLSADVLVLSGGVSLGEADLVPAVLEAEGVTCRFHHWGVQPGGPLWFGARGETLVFGLPGNPAASFVGFVLLVAPAIAAQSGTPFAPREVRRARYEGTWGKPIHRRRFRPARLRTGDDGTLVAVATPWRGSGDPLVAAPADALVVLPEDAPRPADPAPLVDVVLLEEGT